MISQSISLNPGDLIIAPPKMLDHRFRETVIMLTYHNEDASFGLCLNKPTRHRVQDLTREIGVDLDLDIPLYWGGPVNPQTIWMLHSREWNMEGTIDIDDNWAMTSNILMFHRLSANDIPRHFRVFFGFCSWGGEQLEQELEGVPPRTKESSWLTWFNPDDQYLLEVDVEQLWRVATDQCGKQAVSNWLT